MKHLFFLLLLSGCAEILYSPPSVSYVTSITEIGDTVKVIQVKDKYNTSYYVSPCKKDSYE
tara:strand:+ start:567 stop:749 length:183 start_codon:yes stop_codon:yes gene_type:complete